MSRLISSIVPPQEIFKASNSILSCRGRRAKLDPSRRESSVKELTRRRESQLLYGIDEMRRALVGNNATGHRARGLRDQPECVSRAEGDAAHPPSERASSNSSASWSAIASN